MTTKITVINSNNVRENAKQLVVDAVTNLQGCKATELAARVSIDLSDVLDTLDLPTILEELVREKRLIEVSYILPTMTYRLKSFYLPCNTDVHINN